MIGLYPAELLKRGEDIKRCCQKIEAEAPELSVSVFEGEPSRSNSGGFLDLAYLYPYLFQAAFSEVDETVFENLTIAGRLYHEHIMVQDKFFDKDLPLGVGAKNRRGHPRRQRAKSRVMQGNKLGENALAMCGM